MSSRQLLIRVLIVCLLIGYIYFITDYLRQSRLQDELANQINDKAQALTLVPKPASDLQERLARAEQASLLTRQSMAPANVNITQTIDNILKLADKNNLKLTPLSTEQWAKKKAEETTYNVLQMELKIEGDFSDLVTFVQQLEDGKSFPSLAVERVDINAVSEASEPGATEVKPVITADVAVYLFTLAEESH